MLASFHQQGIELRDELKKWPIALSEAVEPVQGLFAVRGLGKPTEIA
jgi:hypothetical protein